MATFGAFGCGVLDWSECDVEGPQVRLRFGRMLVEDWGYGLELDVPKVAVCCFPALFDACFFILERFHRMPLICIQTASQASTVSLRPQSESMKSIKPSVIDALDGRSLTLKLGQRAL